MDRETDSESNWETELADYMFGALDAADAAAFEQKLSECHDHVQMAQQYSLATAWLGLAVPPAEPPKGHKDRLMSRLAATPQDKGTEAPAALVAPRTAETATPSATAAASNIEAAATQSRVTDLSSYREGRRTLAMPLFFATAAAIVLLLGLWGWSQINAARSTLNIPPGYAAFSVKGLDTMPNASAVVILNPQTNDAHLWANGLQPLPADKVYELWLLPPQKGANPVAAGTFKPGSDGAARHDVNAPSKLGDYVGVAVTVEQAPGGNTPKGQMVLLGNYATP